MIECFPEVRREQRPRNDFAIGKVRSVVGFSPNDYTLRERLLDGEVLIGPAVISSTPGVVEMAGAAGFDWLFIDTEQAAAHFGVELEAMVRAADAARIPAMIRVPRADSAEINKALNTGAQGVWIPHVDTAEQARECVMAAKYKPIGNRGAAPVVRAARYGWEDWQVYQERANDSSLLVCIVESARGMVNMDAICAVEGVDVICLGTFDLSVDLGLPIASYSSEAWVHPKIEEVGYRLRESCERYQKIPAVLAWNEECAVKWGEMGYQLILYGTDVSLIGEALRRHKDSAQRVKERLSDTQRHR